MSSSEQLAIIDLRVVDRPQPLLRVAYPAVCLQRIWFRYSGQDEDAPHCSFAISTVPAEATLRLSLHSAEYPVLWFARAFVQFVGYFGGEEPQMPTSFRAKDVEDLQRWLGLAAVTQGFQLRAGVLNGWHRRGLGKLLYPCPVHLALSAQSASRAFNGTALWLDQSIPALAS